MQRAGAAAPVMHRSSHRAVIAGPKSRSSAGAARSTSMTIANAVKKLEKAGYSVSNTGSFFTARKAGSKVIEFIRNGNYDSVATIRVRRVLDQDDSMTDYCAGVFYETITAAIKAA